MRRGARVYPALQSMRKSRSRLFIFLLLSVVIHAHLPLLWRLLPSYEPPLAPVAVRFVEMPAPAAAPEPAQTSPEQQSTPEKPPEPAPLPPQQGGLVVDIPEPVRQQRPREARVVSRYDSVAQDVGPGESGARKPSGPSPPDLPPELNLPERYSTRGATRPRNLPAPAQPPAPTTTVARLAPPASRQPVIPKPVEPPKPTSEQPRPLLVKPVLQDPRYQMTLEEELDMLRRQQEAAGMSEQEAQAGHRRAPGAPGRAPPTARIRHAGRLRGRPGAARRRRRQPRRGR